jgi:uncharacterized membrane protein YkvA (DUF1232 family)
MSTVEQPRIGATTSVNTDPFPREEFTALVKRIPSYARLAWALARDPRLSRARRAAVLAGAAYVLSPIDFVPGIIPVVGQLDDVLIALGAIRLALNGLKPEFRAEVLQAAGLEQPDLDTDLKTTTNIAAWLVRSGARVSVRVGRGAVDTGLRITRAIQRRRAQSSMKR